MLMLRFFFAKAAREHGTQTELQCLDHQQPLVRNWNFGQNWFKLMLR